MNTYESDQSKKEMFHDEEELSTDYDSERDDLPLFEAKGLQQQDTLERALRYSQVLITKAILLLPAGAQTRTWRTPQPRRTHYTIAICLAVLGLFGLVFLSRPDSPTSTETAIANATTLPLTYNRILSASMLFGITSPTYKRAIETHKRQAQRWGYGTEILQRDEGCGFWTKLIFLLNLVGQEMQKPADTRAEWIMWADADALILNPNIPLSIFLPPPDLPHIHFVGNKDWNGLNNGVFFIRVHPWTVSMFTSAMSFPICHKDVDLGGNVEQEAMRLTFERENGGKDDKGWRSGIVFMPRKWFNAYELFQSEIQGSDYYKETINNTVSSYPGLKMAHKYEGARGSMLTHFPGINGDVRQKLMTDWMDLVDEEWSMQYGNGSANATSSANITDPVQFDRMTEAWDRNVTANGTSLWTLPVHETPLLNETTAFWNRYREAMALSLEATSSGAHDISVIKSALDLRIALADDMDRPEHVDEKIQHLKDLMKTRLR
ncbi:hypothetical protein E4T49_00004 [Aureobasidium sp. EXF-10728]|nr:hypothetical protein E4T49_00004 [Aureobasidium sp. EXF-10728]